VLIFLFTASETKLQDCKGHSTPYGPIVTVHVRL